MSRFVSHTFVVEDGLHKGTGMSKLKEVAAKKLYLLEGNWDLTEATALCAAVAIASINCDLGIGAEEGDFTNSLLTIKDADILEEICTVFADDLGVLVEKRSAGNKRRRENEESTIGEQSSGPAAGPVGRARYGPQPLTSLI